jgi:hypothetical protein
MIEDQHESSLTNIQSQSQLNSTKGHPNTSRMVQDILARAKGLPTEGQYHEIAGQYFCLPDYSQMLAWSEHFQITPEDLLGIFLDSSCCFGTSLVPHNHNFYDIAFRVESGRIIDLPWDISKIGGAPPNEWIKGLEIKSLAVYGDCEGDVSSSMHDTLFSPNLPKLLYLVLEHPRNVIVDLSRSSSIKTLMLKGPWFLDDAEQQSSYSVNMSKSAVSHLYCSNLIINSHNLSRHTCLIDLILDRCSVDNLDLSSLSSLASFECLPDDFLGSNYHPLKSLNISSNTKLTSLALGWTDIESLDIRGLALLRRLKLSFNKSLAKISFDESNAVEEFDVYSAHSDLIGSAEFPLFKGVVKLWVRDSNAKVLNLESFSRLEFLDCSHNDLTRVDLSSCSLLRSLNCQNNRIAELNLDPLPSLDTLICNNNQLSRLDLEPTPLLVTLDCSHNSLRSLDLDNKVFLRSLHCSNNQLTQIDLAPCTMLSHLDISENQLTRLDIRHCRELTWFTCELNELDKDHFFAFNKITENFVQGCGDLEELSLSVRAYNVLKRNRVNTLQDLAPISREDLLSMKHINSKCAEEIMRAKERIPWHFISIQSAGN